MGRLSRSLALVVALAPVACDGDEPEPEATFVPADYATTFPVVRECRFSVEHDGVYMRVHADPAAADAYTAGQYPFAPGTIIVKRYFTDAQCSNPDGAAAMLRLGDGEAPDELDWHWQEIDAQRRVTEIEVPRCVMCHAGCTAGRDGACTDP